MTINELKELKKMKIEDINPLELKELNEINISPIVPIEERIGRFFREIENPYCFLVGGTAVQISFANHNQTIENCLSRYLKNMKNSEDMI